MEGREVSSNLEREGALVVLKQLLVSRGAIRLCP